MRHILPIMLVLSMTVLFSFSCKQGGIDAPSGEIVTTGGGVDDAGNQIDIEDQLYAGDEFELEIQTQDYDPVDDSTIVDETDVFRSGGEGPVRLRCVTGDPSINVARSVSASASSASGNVNVFKATISNNYVVRARNLDLFPMEVCDLSITDEIMTVLGTSVISESEETITSFINGCSVNDNFNSDTKSCWPNVYRFDFDPAVMALVDSSWTEIEDILTLEPSLSSLVWEPPSVNIVQILKDVSGTENEIELIVRIKEFSNFFSNQEAIFIFLIDGQNSTDPDATKFLVVGVGKVFPLDDACNVTMTGLGGGLGGGQITAMSDCTALTTTSTGVCVRFYAGPDSVEMGYARATDDGCDVFQVFDTIDPSVGGLRWPTDLDDLLTMLPGDVHVGVGFQGNEPGLMDSVTFNGIEVTGQRTTSVGE